MKIRLAQLRALTPLIPRGALRSALNTALRPRRAGAPPRPDDQAPTGRSIGWDARADGRPDPGEVCWAWVPYEEDASQGKDRPVLVVGTEGRDLLALMLTSKDHDRDAAQERRAGREWMDVGSGAWDSQRRPSEVRLDRLLRLDPDGVRREGAALDRSTFDAVVDAARPWL
ncbi:PemK-like, MazF-like toxin of type II toxin-antitoxin system [Nocardioides scoriae]|uniref:PemK-like, MazF-like toxin of type II toxin-antitoxin system n=1 Tax=Nocardioides scoriae TaxID=642780 RepID=A0A1H1MPU6_9ACTN|nr:type II toxin-antitoxin system PemK/MazF family toxin [Nocardioides scoriae]SDR88640.1 PemK-like, MazF-like toxin of type II toxin-antitoxin system [Nocardioides scoriae]